MSNSKTERDNAFQQACRYLSSRALSEMELSMKLKRKGFTREAVEDALERLKEFKYLNDRELAESVGQGLADRDYGPIRVRKKLLDRGFDESLSEEILEDLFERVDLVAAAVKCGRRRDKTLANKPLLKRKASVMRHLSGRGFPMESIGRAMEEIYEHEG